MRTMGNFIEIIPGWLVDSEFRLRLNTSGHKESSGHDAVLNITFDPELRPDRLTVPPTPEQRARRLSTPSLAHLADMPLPFESDKRVTLASFPFFWAEPTSNIIFKIERDLYAFKLLSAVFERQGFPVVGMDLKTTLLHAIGAIVNFSEIRGFRISQRYPYVEDVAVAIQTDVAWHFFNLNSIDYAEGDTNWTTIKKGTVRQ